MNKLIKNEGLREDVYFYDIFLREIPFHKIHQYEKCTVCGLYIWRNSCILGLCPKCTLNLPTFILEVSFGKSISKNYKTALRRIKAFPSYYEQEGERHIVRFGSLSECYTHWHKLDSLIWLVSDWKSFALRFNNQNIEINHVIALNAELERIRKQNGYIYMTVLEDGTICSI